MIGRAAHFMLQSKAPIPTGITATPNLTL
jgi:hypothetical protein